MPFLQEQKTVTGTYDNTLTNNRNLRRVAVNQTKLLKSSHVNVNMTFFACLIDYRLLMGGRVDRCFNNVSCYAAQHAVATKPLTEPFYYPQI